MMLSKILPLLIIILILILAILINSILCHNKSYNLIGGLNGNYFVRNSIDYTAYINVEYIALLWPYAKWSNHSYKEYFDDIYNRIVTNVPIPLSPIFTNREGIQQEIPILHSLKSTTKTGNGWYLSDHSTHNFDNHIHLFENGTYKYKFTNGLRCIHIPHNDTTGDACNCYYYTIYPLDAIDYPYIDRSCLKRFPPLEAMPRNPKPQDKVNTRYNRQCAYCELRDNVYDIPFDEPLIRALYIARKITQFLWLRNYWEHLNFIKTGKEQKNINNIPRQISHLVLLNPEIDINSLIHWANSRIARPFDDIIYNEQGIIIGQLIHFIEGLKNPQTSPPPSPPPPPPSPPLEIEDNSPPLVQIEDNSPPPVHMDSTPSTVQIEGAPQPSV